MGDSRKAGAEYAEEVGRIVRKLRALRGELPHLSSTAQHLREMCDKGRWTEEERKLLRKALSSFETALKLRAGLPTISVYHPEWVEAFDNVVREGDLDS